MLHGQKNPKNIIQKQYYNKLNKDFKNGPHQNNLKKKMYDKNISDSQRSFSVNIAVIRVDSE